MWLPHLRAGESIGSERLDFTFEGGRLLDLGQRTDDKGTFGYFLEANLRIEGRSGAEARALAAEWRRGVELFRKGGT